MAIAQYASKFTLPNPNPGVNTVLEYLLIKFPRIDRAIWEVRLAEGKVHWHDGSLIRSTTRYREQARVYYYREVVNEPKIPFQETIVYQDENILVVHKPHFLALIPGGVFVTECLQTRLRKSLDNNEIQALHRLDRVTAGLVIFSLNSNNRHAYHTLFAERKIRKVYHAVAQVDASTNLTGQTWEVKNRLEASNPHYLMRVCPGNSNSHSKVTCLQHSGDRALFELEPVTGRTHQLRVHMQSIGMPILNDKYYPILEEHSADDFKKPLQLLAKSLKFVDPVSGKKHFFESPCSLKEDQWRC